MWQNNTSHWMQPSAYKRKSGKRRGCVVLITKRKISETLPNIIRHIEGCQQVLMSCSTTLYTAPSFLQDTLKCKVLKTQVS